MKGDMIMKKGFLAVFLISALVMAIGLAACSSGEKASSEASSEASAEAASTEAVSEESSDASAEAATSEAAEAESDEVVEPDSGAYGYAGADPAEAAIYKYMVEEVGKNFDKADASIPTVAIVNVDDSNPDEVIVYGDFWVDNYNINGDTLECVSGGNFPGVMHLAKYFDGYVVASLDQVEDGANFEPSAKELFGENYDAFMKVYSDDEARAELRKATVSDYVRLNSLEVTQFQDYGWDPVQLDK